MKKLIKLSAICALGMSSLFAGEVLSTDKINEMLKDNKVLSNPNVSVKKAEKISENLTTLKLGVKYQTQQGVTERPAQGFLVNVDGKEYTFLGGGYDEEGAKVAFSLDSKVIEEGTAWSHGTGPEVIYIVTNPSCPWCEKIEQSIADSKDFLTKYTVKSVLMPFNQFAEEKATWVLAGKDDAEKAERYKKLMVDKDESWKSFKPTAEEKTKIDALIAKSLDAARELEAEGTPAVYDSKFQQIENWPALVK